VLHTVSLVLLVSQNTIIFYQKLRQDTQKQSKSIRTTFQKFKLLTLVLKRAGFTHQWAEINTVSSHFGNKLNPSPPLVIGIIAVD